MTFWEEYEQLRECRAQECVGACCGVAEKAGVFGERSQELGVRSQNGEGSRKGKGNSGAFVRIRKGAESGKTGVPVNEDVVQRIWRDQQFRMEGLQTEDGRSLKVLSPGWWNRGEGPDFQGAQIEVGGRLRTGDVEVHLDTAAWTQHGHHLDTRYDEVILEVVLKGRAHAGTGKAVGVEAGFGKNSCAHAPCANAPCANAPFATTSAGQPVPRLFLQAYLEHEFVDVSEEPSLDGPPDGEPLGAGQCAAIVEAYGADSVLRLLVLAGEWRLHTKARLLTDRIERVGADQAIYEAFMAACGYSRYKHEFRVLAEQFPYDRVRQLGRQDGPLLVETALLQVAGLLPESLPEGAASVPHFERLQALRQQALPGLRSLNLAWHKAGVRPNNHPERRLAGAARFLVRTAKEGLAATLDSVWREEHTPTSRRKAFEALFPSIMAGFWATHCTWTGQKLSKAMTPLGAGRIRSIIGNVFAPAAFAQARLARDRRREEQVLAFYAALPKEPGNHVVEAMMPRLFGDVKLRKPLDFRAQQGLIQIYQDWCESNASCRNCAVIPFLDVGYAPRAARGPEGAG